ncbi:hypothetical protein GLAREA_08516 [Glarea lozoyensis ATCC 20868]|uniref:Uncharacterized protein n=1 Tax=Glarea lozoyensis (strain ATCC 20868 / MF5171) TaxID=1116229 RepID=S3DDB5_GLAL2|nr:uncharacterized protein GLAREA_08516 [Glarea lozoyensis ATCC 20868]EPE24663.1 hypothetical protein GLAREA_08516 [Glarea lozoyensis ATCC 20868]
MVTGCLGQDRLFLFRIVFTSISSKPLFPTNSTLPIHSPLTTLALASLNLSQSPAPKLNSFTLKTCLSNRHEAVLLREGTAEGKFDTTCPDFKIVDQTLRGEGVCGRCRRREERQEERREIAMREGKERAGSWVADSGVQGGLVVDYRGEIVGLEGCGMEGLEKGVGEGKRGVNRIQSGDMDVGGHGLDFGGDEREKRVKEELSGLEKELGDLERAMEKERENS